MRLSASVTPVALAGLFSIATCMSLLCGLSLVFANPVLDQLWTSYPVQHQQFLRILPWSAMGFSGLALIMAATALATYAQLRIGWVLSISVLTFNGAADASSALFGHDLQALIGAILASILVFHLLRTQTKDLFTARLEAYRD